MVGSAVSLAQAGATVVDMPAHYARAELAHGAALNATARRAESPPDTPGDLNQALSTPNGKK